MSDITFKYPVIISHERPHVIDLLDWFHSRDYKLFVDYDYTSEPRNSQYVYIFIFVDKNVATEFALVHSE
jgi:hypothetical protein